MEKSNDTPEITQTGAQVEKNLLIIVSRRLDMTKQFFAWVMAVYFFATLCSIGGLWVDIFAPIARAGLGVVIFAAGALLYSLLSYGFVLQGGIFLKLRFVALVVIIGVFGFALARFFALI